VGIDALRFAGEAQKAQKTGESRRLVSSMAGRSLIIGVDRLDYSKGLLNRFEGYSRFLRGHPEFKNKVSYLQIAPKSREEVDEYRSLKRDLDRMVGHINGLFSEFDWTPIRYLTRPVPRTAIAGFYRTARIGLVTPLRDGMNLVAKEFVAAQDPEDPGVLVLSRFAGAADELQDALLVNPFDPDDIAEKIRMALQLDRHDRRVRHCKLLKAVTFNSDERFCRTFLGLLRGEGDRIPTGACGLDFAPIVMRLAEFHWPKQVATWRRLIPPKLAVN
jgi:trehalose 6-phosphate synthase